MCDDDEQLRDTNWTDASSIPLHWTDAPIFAFKVAEELARVAMRTAEFAGGMFKSHSNAAYDRRVWRDAALKDIEAMTGGADV